MKFIEAFKAMKEGKKVKLPSWAGYWVYDPDGDRIMMHCKDGRFLEIRETDRLSYTLDNICSDDWIIADETNTPELGGVATFSFGEAIKYLKRGFKVARLGWNGKNQYVFLADDVEFSTEADISEFCGSADGVYVASMLVLRTAQGNLQPGWLASQSDMLAEDWIFVD